MFTASVNSGMRRWIENEHSSKTSTFHDEDRYHIKLHNQQHFQF